MIAIVILNYKNWKDTLRCVKSIAKYPPKEAYQIILVDNASGNAPEYDLKEFIQEYRVLYIENSKNLGYNAGNNVGIRKAQEIGSDHILISNNDVCFLPDSIQRMKDYLDAHPDTGIVGPKVLDREGKIQTDSICRKTGLKEKYMVRTKANLLFRKEHRSYFGLDKDYNQEFEAYSVLGCCFMLSARCAQAIMPLDEHPFLYEEELMLGIRMEEKGFRTVYYPNAAIEHLHGGSTRQQKAFSFAHNVRSEIYYCKTYLRAGKAAIYPLYLYRVGLYLLRCVRSDDFRKHWNWFLRMTREELG